MDIETAMMVITYMTNIVDDVFHRIIEHDFGISEFTANMRRVKSMKIIKHQKKIYMQQEIWQE